MTNPTPYDRQRLRAFVRVFYDFQNLRLRTGGRVDAASENKKDGSGKKKAPQSVMAPEDVELVTQWMNRLEATEADALAVIETELERDPVYTGFLKDIPGVGPTMGAVLLGGGFNIVKEDTVSKMWAYVGLAPSIDPYCRRCAKWIHPDEIDGTVHIKCGKPFELLRSDRQHRGVKSKGNPELKTKVVGVLPDCIMKACVRDTLGGKPKGSGWVLVEHSWMQTTMKYKPAVTETGEKVKVKVEVPPARWVKSYAVIYYNYRHRKQCQIGLCELCKGTGKVSKAQAEEYAEVAAEHAETLEEVSGATAPETITASAKQMPCWNCDGATKPAPWGRGDAHRHRAALRYMIKMLLLDFWRVWRTAEGLPVREPYYVEKLGMAPHNSSEG